LLVALIVVGPAKLPEIGRQIGKGLREFRKVQDEVRDSIRMNIDDEPPRVPTRQAPTVPTPTERVPVDGEVQRAPIAEVAPQPRHEADQALGAEEPTPPATEADEPDREDSAE
jgi:sec-independent protein translocase protein TatB